MHNEKIDDYILTHSDPVPDYLRYIERDTNLRLINGRMCSGHTQGRLLKMLTRLINPKTVVELGTFSGYSALCIAEGLSPDARFITVEADDELEDTIRRNFALSPFADRIELCIDDASRVMQRIPDNSVDLIFVDADKRAYPDYYREAKRILSHGGYILADNTLWDGHVVEPHNPKDRQTAGIKTFNDIVAADPDLEKVIIPLRDGLTLIRKK